MIKKYNAKYFMASVDPLEGEKGNKEFAKAHKADFPLLSDPTKETATAYGVLSDRGVANRWTFYIGKDGKILAIDKQVKPATSARRHRRHAQAARRGRTSQVGRPAAKRTGSDPRLRPW